MENPEVLKWGELNGEWIFETGFGCLIINDGEEFRSGLDGEKAFFASWDWEDDNDTLGFVIGWFDTVDEAKKACIRDLERRVKPIIAYLGFDHDDVHPNVECCGETEKHPDTINRESEEDGCDTGHEAVANLSDTYYRLRDAFECLCVDATKRDPGYFYCEGPGVEKCKWRKEGVHRCLAPEGYYCHATHLDGIGVGKPEET